MFLRLNRFSRSLDIQKRSEELSCWTSEIANKSGGENHEEGGNDCSETKLSPDYLHYLSNNDIVGYLKYVTFSNQALTWDRITLANVSSRGDMRDKSNLIGFFIPDRVKVSDEHISQEPLIRSELGESNQTFSWHSNINLQNIVCWSNLEVLVFSIQKDTFVQRHIAAA
jgi:hypothetical protein